MQTTTTNSTPGLQIKEIKPIRTAAIVERSAPINFGGAWGKAMPLLGAINATKKTFAAFQTKTLSPPKMEWYAAAGAVDAQQTIAAPLEEVAVAGGRFCVFVHVGGYDGLGQAWPDFIAAFAEAGHKLDPSRACFEHYVDDGKSQKDQLPRTELCIPVM